MRPFLLGSARKSYLPENRTLSCQKIVPSRKMYLFPENRTCFSFFQKNVPIFRNSYNNPVPVITQRIQKIWLPEICTYFHFFRNYLHKYIQRIYILLIFVPNNN